MTIAASAVADPIPKLLSGIPIVDPKTGMLTGHGVQVLDKWWQNMVGGNRVIPCSASGTNVITLTPNDAHPLLAQYGDYDIFVFVAANTSTGLVTATVVPDTGALATLKVYKTSGAAQATTGDVVANSLYLAVFADHLNSSAGGLVLK